MLSFGITARYGVIARARQRLAGGYSYGGHLRAVAAQMLGVQFYRVEVRAPGDIPAAFAEIGKIPVEALVLFTEPMIFNERRRIADSQAGRMEQSLRV
jgi:hypothetical protein